VGAVLLDWAFVYAAGAGAFAVGSALTAIANVSEGVTVTLVLVAALGMWVWNFVIRQGRHGDTYGKTILGLVLGDIDTGEPVGPGRSLGRYLTFALLYAAPFGALVDLLWPLWDHHGQRLSDKAVHAQVRDSS
jgi:uncharacterized RDD family membrane protein YckC